MPALSERFPDRASFRAVSRAVLVVFLGLGAFPENPRAAVRPACSPLSFSLSGNHRTRFESVDRRLRAGSQGGDQMLALRTDLTAALRRSGFEAGAEFMDSRQGLADSDSPIGTSMVNTLELLQAWAGWEGGVPAGGRLSVKLGRQTADLGSRRLVARNRFRNTVNAFDGLSSVWSHDDLRLRAFFFLPMQRRPSAASELLDNEARPDREDFDFRFWGVYGERSGLPGGMRFELSVLVLEEDDDAERPSRGRRLYTPWARLRQPPARGRVDFEAEAALQAGKSRSSTSSTRDLTHLAFFKHVEAGYTFDHRWEPRAAFQYDYASGDRDPADGWNNRFDTLFGARRFDFGPTGIYGPFERSNISSPGLRFTARPRPAWDVMSAVRAYWLASSKDSWGAAGLTDAAGGSGGFLGVQAELRLRWEALPGNLKLEAGAAQLLKGRFAREAPGAPSPGGSSYGYLQAVLSL